MAKNLNRNVKDWNVVTDMEARKHSFDVNVLSNMRKGLSFDQAYAESKKRYGSNNWKTPGKAKTKESLKPYLKVGYARNSKGRGVSRLVAKHEDNMLRRMTIINAGGKTENVLVRGSKNAKKLANYWAAVNEYLRTGETDLLVDYTNGTVVLADGTTYHYVTDSDLLDYMDYTGEMTDLIISE